MDFEPILLKASLRAVLSNIVSYTLRTREVTDELLVKLFTFLHIYRWVVDTILLVFPHMLQRAFVVFALTHMDHFVRWWVWDTVTYFTRNAYGCCVHDA